MHFTGLYFEVDAFEDLFVVDRRFEVAYFEHS